MVPIGLVASEENMPENVDGQRTKDDGWQTDAWIYYKLTFGLGELENL